MRNQIIDSRQIAAFAALVRHRSFTLAAQNLYLTQSAVSHAIKSLERDVGCRLFERSGRTISLTRAGRQFHARTENILSEMRAARVEIESLSVSDPSELCVGAGTLACQYLLPRVLPEFRQSHPQCRVRLEPGNLPNLLEMLHANQIDLALGMDSVRSDEFSFEHIFEDELQFFVGAQHPWAVSKRVRRADFGTETFIVPMKHGQTIMVLEKYFRTENITPKNLIAAGSQDAAKELVVAGFGVGFFSPWQVAAETSAGSLVAAMLTAKRLTRSWVVARLKGHEPLRIEQEFVDRCKSVLGALSAVASFLFLLPV